MEEHPKLLEEVFDLINKGTPARTENDDLATIFLDEDIDNLGDRIGEYLNGCAVRTNEEEGDDS